MNKTVLGILGFLLLAPGLVILGVGGIFVGPLLCAAGIGLLVLALKPEAFKRYIFTVATVLLVAGALLALGLFVASHITIGAEVHSLSP